MERLFISAFRWCINLNFKKVTLMTGFVLQGHICGHTLTVCLWLFVCLVPAGFAPSQPFAQSGYHGAPVGFMSGPSMPSSNLSWPSVPPSSPPGPMMPAPPAPGFLSPTSLPGGPVPFFPSAPHTQAPGGAYPALGAGYPQGGPGAPAARRFSGAGVPAPPTGTCRRLEDPLNTAVSRVYLYWSAVWFPGYFPWLMCHTEEEGDRERDVCVCVCVFKRDSSYPNSALLIFNADWLQVISIFTHWSCCASCVISLSFMGINACVTSQCW